MKCQKCAHEFVGNVCPACGYPVLAMGGTAAKTAASGGAGGVAYRVPVKEPGRKAPAKRRGKRVFALSLLIPVLLLVAAGTLLFMQGPGRASRMRSEMEQAVQAGGRDEARRLLDSYFSEDPADEDIYLLYAEFFLMEDDYHSALEILEAGLADAQTSERIVEKQMEIQAAYAEEIQREQEQAAAAEKEAELQRAGVSFLEQNGFTREQALAFLRATALYGRAVPNGVSAEDTEWEVRFEDGRRYLVVFADGSPEIVTLRDRHGQYLIEEGRENVEYFSFDDIDWATLVGQLKEKVRPYLPPGTAVYADDAWEYSLTGERSLVVYGSAKVTSDTGVTQTVEIRAQYRVTEDGRLALGEVRVNDQIFTV